MVDGITLAGFNIVDIKELNERTGIPVIVINRKLPDLEKVRRALKRFDDFEERWKAVENAGEIKECYVKKGKKIYFQAKGMNEETAREVIKISTTRSFIPEPLRIAHIIATGIVRGESYGRA